MAGVLDHPETVPETEGSSQALGLAPRRDDDGTGDTALGRIAVGDGAACGDGRASTLCPGALPPVSDVPRLGTKTPLSAGRALACWSPVSLAMALDRGLIVHTPFEFTRAGWRWVRRTCSATEQTS